MSCKRERSNRCKRPAELGDPTPSGGGDGGDSGCPGTFADVRPVPPRRLPRDEDEVGCGRPDMFGDDGRSVMGILMLRSPGRMVPMSMRI